MLDDSDSPQNCNFGHRVRLAWRALLYGDEALTPARGAALVEADLITIQALVYHAQWLANRWQRELGPALQSLGSRHATECHEHILMIARTARMLQRRAQAAAMAG